MVWSEQPVQPAEKGSDIFFFASSRIKELATDGEEKSSDVKLYSDWCGVYFYQEYRVKKKIYIYIMY